MTGIYCNICGKHVRGATLHTCGLPDTATLTERLAQAERRYQDKLEEMGAALAQSERERDEWKAKAAPLTPYGQQLLDQRTAERDAALAKAEAAEKDCAAITVGFNVVRGELETWEEEAQRTSNELLAEKDAHADLRARIEALADEWEVPSPNGRHYSALLRALLQPAKAKTALDVLTDLEKANLADNGDMVADNIAKLRKLLEQTP